LSAILEAGLGRDQEKGLVAVLEEGMIDINLTGQLWGMPVSLIGQAAHACNISTLPANLTIVNQMAATNTWIIAAIGALGAIFGALASSLATYFIERLKIKNTNTQRRQQVYSQLIGRKRLWLQYYATYHTNLIALEKSLALQKWGLGFSDPRLTREGKKKLEDELNKNREVFKEFTTKSDDLAIGLAKSGQEMWETIGLVRVLFADTQRLRNLLRDIEMFDKAFENFEDEIIKDRENGLIIITLRQLGESNNFDLATDWPERKVQKLKEDYINIYVLITQ